MNKKKFTKLLALYLPYLVIGLAATNLGEAWRLAEGKELGDKIVSLMGTLPAAFANPLPSLHPLDILVGICCGAGLRLAVYLKSKNAKKYRHGMEYGSARWGTPADIAPFMAPKFEDNIILTKTERLMMSNRPPDPKNARNKNVLVVGGSGSGKTRYFIKPNLLQCTSKSHPVSFVVTDPKGGLIQECGLALLKNGYKIKTMNTINFHKSMRYNPFAYIHEEKDILKLVTTLMTNTKGEGQGGDPFWDKAERLLLTSLIAYLHYEAPAEEQNFATLLEMLNTMQVSEEDEDYQNPVDLLFEDLARKKPNSFAGRQYKLYKLAAGKTAKSILISCGARLAPFDIQELRDRTMYDELELDMLGDRKTALFLIMSDTDSTFNFLISMVYTQLFNLLCDKADDKYGGKLPVHVRCLIDECANIGQIPNLEKLVATIRSREISACLVLQALFYGWGLNLSHKAAYDTLLRLRTALQKRFEKLPLGVIQDKGTGTVKKLFVDDVDSLEVLLAHSMPEGIANLMIPIAVYVAMFFVDWKLALLSLASIPISLIAMMTMYSVGMKKMGPYYMAGQKMNNTIIEYINGMEVVKVFNKDADSYERFRKDVSDYRDYTLAWYKAAWPWMAIYSSLLPCTIILTLPVGAWFVLSGWSTLPNLILVLCLSLSIGMPLLKSLGFLPTMPQLNYKISALEQVLDAPELQQTEDAFHGKDDTITYDHVSFAYQTTQPGPDGKPVVIEDEVLHDISFTAKAGQKTALVGESGSGKSTLAKLLIHYYDPQKGSISIGGQKLCDMSLEALNSRISYVAQDQYLFNTSLLENIRLGRLNATDEEVVEAAKKAQCMEFLEKLPQGIHSMAGDAGKMLSGGQRQRISLARAILKDAPIVVLDEATAYADPENEEKMEAAIAELVKGKTLVVIAHKLPAIMNADQICVMDHGKLVATGRHQELIQSCPEYQKLWKAAQDSAEWKVHTAKEGK